MLRKNRIRSRSEWKAAPARSGRGSTARPVSKVFIHHTVTSAVTRSVSQEKAHMRELQQIAFSRGFSDISYSFIVFPSGRMYEGRGWGVAGAHTLDHNSTAYGIALVGNFELYAPTDAALKAAARIIKKGRRASWIRPANQTQILGHRDSSSASTACPGKRLYSRLHYIKAMAR